MGPSKRSKTLLSFPTLATGGRALQQLEYVGKKLVLATYGAGGEAFFFSGKKGKAIGTSTPMMMHRWSWYKYTGKEYRGSSLEGWKALLLLDTPPLHAPFSSQDAETRCERALLHIRAQDRPSDTYFLPVAGAPCWGHDRRKTDMSPR